MQREINIRCMVRKFLNYFFAAVATTSVTVLYTRFITEVSSATVSLTLVLVVLITSLLAGMGAGIFSALLTAVCFNYFFLPPTGTFTISDPQDWVSFAVYLICAIVVSHLSASIKKRAVEAEAHRDSLMRLCRVSTRLIPANDVSARLSDLAHLLVETFALEYCGIHLLQENGKWQTYSAAAAGSESANPPEPISVNSLLEEYERGVRY